MNSGRVIMDDQSFRDDAGEPDGTQTAILRAVLSRRGFEPSIDIHAISDALALGQNELGGALVPAETVEACERRTGRCFFIRRRADGAAEGFIALLYLNRNGFEALMFGRFTPEAPDLEHLAAPSERALAIYVWCLAGTTPEARRAVVRAVTEARRKAFPDIALFARPVSRQGRMMTAALDAPGAGAAWLGWVPARPVDDATQAKET
jgi:hypothetical protein